MLKDNEIRMQLKHQQLIKSGRKKTTLRSEKLPKGTYRMVAIGGKSMGSVRVFHHNRDEPSLIDWTVGTDRFRESIAQTEGYQSVAEFEQFMRGFARGMGKNFIEGKKKLYLHHVEYVGDDQ